MDPVWKGFGNRVASGYCASWEIWIVLAISTSSDNHERAACNSNSCFISGTRKPICITDTRFRIITVNSPATCYTSTPHCVFLCILEKEKTRRREKSNAIAGNRTRAWSVAGTYLTTWLLLLCFAFKHHPFHAHPPTQLQHHIPTSHESMEECAVHSPPPLHPLHPYVRFSHSLHCSALSSFFWNPTSLLM